MVKSLLKVEWPSTAYDGLVKTTCVVEVRGEVDCEKGG